jgi:hypothetical protein
VAEYSTIWCRDNPEHASRRIKKLEDALRAIEARHVKGNAMAGRNERESVTLRICREALVS